ncbi:2-phosphosulfolactate phosphatase [Lentibacillus halodurans]|uniref:Probable 2-phosphosulfolactate phosphatase n=1 Tax=Lentibacillus halodurans TaxID=237679 RepID=A0A1I0W9G6_9BACI|nr:2-phosphosulfolactate phosphatase [Lentibacillus halodurans]SFA84928.1 2-phosphosulfolactate phosphatase [Lentibacillus halodurans]
MYISIYQGRTAPSTVADITIVIDVIRAFTLAHYAFLQGVSRIYLVETVDQAFEIKQENPEYLLAGETAGYAIEGFDIDNSPYHLQQKNLSGKTLVQKTTNGVRAALNNLPSDHVFVTGFTNARQTAEFVRERFADEKEKTVHIIASHPDGDDDLACAKYIKSILENANSLSALEVRERIKRSHVAGKFFDKRNTAFIQEDIAYCIRELDTNFVMKVNKTTEIPMIERVTV